MWVKCAGSSRSMAPARMSHLPPCDREPSRLAILARMLEGGRENSQPREGIGSGARCAVEPPKRRWLTRKETARQSRVSTGRNTACRPEETGLRGFELAELLACSADRQVQIVSKFGHTARLLLDRR